MPLLSPRETELLAMVLEEAFPEEEVALTDEDRAKISQVGIACYLLGRGDERLYKLIKRKPD